MAAVRLPCFRSAVLFSGNFQYFGCVRLSHTLLRCAHNRYTRLSYCTSSTDDNGVDVSYESGLPIFRVPLPSRGERCRFTLRPTADTLHRLASDLRQEDPGIEVVTAYHTDGTRIAKSTPIDVLLRDDFELQINARRYKVASAFPDLSEETEEICQVKNSIAQLYTTLNIEQHQLDRQRHLQETLDQLREDILPFEEKKLLIESAALRRVSRLQWLGLGLMGLQFGVLARLTWWDYSWDIMEPVTYFITYGTAIGMYAYYVLTKQEYNFKEICDREFLLSLHRNAAKSQLSIGRYNALRASITAAEYDLRRLRDPLQLQLPLRQLLPHADDGADGDESTNAR